MSTTTKNKVKVDNAICEGNPQRLAEAAIEQCSKSTTMIKDVCGIVASSIFYYRKIVPEDLFIDKKFGKQTIKIIKNNTGHVYADNLCKAIYSFYEAISLGYLKELSIVILEKDAIVEKHSLKLEYDGTQYKSMILNQSITNPKLERKWCVEQLKSQVLTTLEHFILTLKSVNASYDNHELGFKLDYNSVAPSGYQAPCFEPYDPNNKKHLVGRPIHIGDVMTPFHSVALKSHYSKKITKLIMDPLYGTGDTQIVDLNKQKNLDEKSTSAAETVVITDITTDAVVDVTDMELTPVAGEAQSAQDTMDIDVTSVTAEDNEFESYVSQAGKISIESKRIRCPCQLNLEYGPMIQCKSCSKYQHMFCFDILKPTHAPASHTCDNCAANDSSLSCTIRGLQRLNNLDRTDRALFRLCLVVIYREEGRADAALLVKHLKIEEDLADYLITRMIQLKAIVQNESGNKVNRSFVKNTIIPKYFVDHNKKDDTQTEPKEKKRQRAI